MSRSPLALISCYIMLAYCICRDHIESTIKSVDSGALTFDEFHSKLGLTVSKSELSKCHRFVDKRDSPQSEVFKNQPTSVIHMLRLDHRIFHRCDALSEKLKITTMFFQSALSSTSTMNLCTLVPKHAPGVFDCTVLATCHMMSVCGTACHNYR